MAAIPDELQRMLTKMVEAKEELKEATAQAHAARRDLLRAIKANTDTITEAIAAEVEAQVGALADTTTEEMRAQASAVVEALAAEWRHKLGLVG